MNRVCGNVAVRSYDLDRYVAVAWRFGSHPVYYDSRSARVQPPYGPREVRTALLKLIPRVREYIYAGRR